MNRIRIKKGDTEIELIDDRDYRTHEFLVKILDEVIKDIILLERGVDAPEGAGK